ncbi:MAG: helix-turn-helix transcriptional regulator [Prolixibacteraceae bacterium]|nr:helix-turn-helix transcriptional regulator [Prolixibacteraceae bacterium]
MEVIAWIGLSQALFSGLLTLTKKNKSEADRLLSGMLFLLAIEFLTFGVEASIFPNFLFLTNSFLLFNPALYLYILSVSHPGFCLKKVQLFHLLPYVFFKITAWALKEPQSYEQFFSSDQSLWFRILFGISGIVSWVIYLILSGLAINKHRKTVQNEFSTIDNYKKISWLLFIIISYIAYCLIVLFWGIFNIVFSDALSITFFNYSALLLFVYIFGFYGLKQQELFPKKAKAERYKNPVLDKEKAEKIAKKVKKLFETENLFLTPDLNMQMLSDKLKLPKHHITEAINGYFGKNFFQLVNEYRIELVKQQLNNPKKPYSIEAIGYECGFNSKSTFFTVFKKFTGLTPEQYKQAYSKNTKKNKK